MFALISSRSGSQSAMMLRCALQGHHGPLIFDLWLVHCLSWLVSSSLGYDLLKWLFLDIYTIYLVSEVFAYFSLVFIISGHFSLITPSSPQTKTDTFATSVKSDEPSHQDLL